MLVCKCRNVNYDAVESAVKAHGTDVKVIMGETAAGTACGCCLKDGCPKVELPLPQAITKASEA